MKRRRHLIPLILFLLSFGISLGIVVVRWFTIRTMLDFAGKNNRPVIAATSGSLGEKQYVILLSLDHGPVQVPVDFGNYSFNRAKPIFSPDGSLLFNKYLETPSVIWALETPLPSIATSRNTQIVFTSLPVNYQRLNYVINRGGLTYARIQRQPRVLDRYRILDFVNQVEYTGEFHYPVPFEFSVREYSHVMASGDGTRIFAIDFTRGDRKLQMYDRTENIWTEVLELGDINLECVSEDGSIVGLWEQTFDEPFLFVDSNTGEELHSTQGIERVTIGKRWVAGLALVYRGGGVGRQFIVIDMEDDWKEYRFGPINVDWETVALYEPPSGGIREMMEMRE